MKKASRNVFREGNAEKSELLQNLAADARRAAARNFGAEVLGSLAGAARENAVWLALSLVEEADDGRFYHTAFLVDGSGTVVGKYRKAHLGAEEAWVRTRMNNNE